MPLNLFLDLVRNNTGQKHTVRLTKELVEQYGVIISHVCITL